MLLTILAHTAGAAATFSSASPKAPKNMLRAAPVRLTICQSLYFAPYCHP